MSDEGSGARRLLRTHTSGVQVRYMPALVAAAYAGVLLATGTTSVLTGWRRGLFVPMALAAGIAMTVLCAGQLVAAREWGALSLLLLLHSRGLVHIGQRLTLALPGVAGLLLLARAWAVDGDGDTRLVVFAVLLAAAAGLVIATWTVPGRRMLPYWGRAAELAHTVFAVALLPLSLWVAGLFGWLRGLFG